MADELVPAVDVARNTIRGRACPRCGGKIIPSNRAVYQSTTAPGDLFPLWECERCGYAELSEKKAPPPKPAHAPKKPPPKADAEGASE